MALVRVTSAISHHPIMDYGFLCWAAKKYINTNLIYIWHSNPHNPLWDDEKWHYFLINNGLWFLCWAAKIY